MCETFAVYMFVFSDVSIKMQRF